MTPRPPTARDLRSFGLVMLVALVALAVWAWRRGHPVAWSYGLAGAGGALALVGMVAPAALGPVYRAWMALGRAMGRVTTPVALALVYLVVFVPVRALLALTRRDPLGMRPDRGAASYWVERPRQTFSRDDFERLS